jgi:hypothetical protein
MLYNVYVYTIYFYMNIIDRTSVLSGNIQSYMLNVVKIKGLVKMSVLAGKSS